MLLFVSACSHAVSPEVAQLHVSEDPPSAECVNLGPVRATHSGNDRQLILKHAANKLRAAGYALSADYIHHDSTTERGIPLGWRGMGGVGPEISLSGQAYRCAAPAGQ